MKSLGARLVFYYSLVVTLTVGLTMVVGFFLVKHHVVSGTDFLLDAEYKEVDAMLAKCAPPLTAEVLRQALYEHSLLDASMYFFQIHDDAGTLLFRSLNLGGKTLPDLGLREPNDRSRRASVRADGPGMIRLTEYYHRGLHVQIATSLEFLTALTSRFAAGLAMGLPAVMVVSLAVGFVLSEITLRPLRMIQRTARRISVSNLSERIPARQTRDELAMLSTLLNDMFDRLETAFNRTREFTAQMSHELRTPLSIIRLHTEKALKQKNLPEEVAVELRESIEEVERLDGIINQLLVLAKADAQVLPLHPAAQSTSQFIEQFAEDAMALAEHEGRAFELVANQEVHATFDAPWIRQVLFNLISNALKFSPPKTVVRLESIREGTQWRVTLADQGEGVPESDFTRIFEPFTQVKNHGLAGNGSGLGLAVCKRIVELHHGTIFCQKFSAPPGFAITFSLPISV